MKGPTVCAFISAKGGPGKTVLSTSLAVLLGAIGKHVLLVDCDAATNGLSLLHLEQIVAFRDEDRQAQGLFEATGQNSPHVLTVGENVDLVPATYRMRQTEETALQDVAEALNRLILDVGHEYDFVFLDAQAGADTHAEMALSYANKAIIVTEYDPISAEGVERLKRLFSRSLENIETWTLFNKVLPEFASMRSDFLEVVRLLPLVPWDADVIRSFTRRKLAVDTNAGNPYTFALVSVLESLFYREIGEDLEFWRTRTENFLREPIKARLDSLEEEISKVEAALVQTNYESRTLEGRHTGYFLVIIIIVMSVTTLSYVTINAVWSVDRNQSLSISIALAVALLSIWALVWSASDMGNRAKREEERRAKERQALALQRRRSQLEEDIRRYRQLVTADVNTLSMESRDISASPPQS